MSSHYAPSPGNTCAVVVAFNPEPEFANTVVALLQQVVQVVIVDNSTSGGVPDSVQALADSQPVRVLRNAENVGIGGALNLGLAEAEIIPGIEWALLLDQDSIPLPHLMEEMQAVYRVLPHPDLVAQICANFVESAEGPEGYPYRRFGERIWMYSDTGQTSGTLLSLRAWRVAGKMRAEFFLYWVDVEYGLRLKRLGWQTVLTQKPLIMHHTGNARVVDWMGQRVALHDYAPARHYFLVRNHMVLLREYAAINPVWALRSIGSRIRKIFVTVVLEDNRLAKLQAMGHGFCDGVRGRLDENPLLAPSGRV